MIELVLRVPEALVEPVSDALTDDCEALSVSIEDADAGGTAEQALYGEPGMAPPAAGWQRSTLRALFETERAAEAAAAAVLARFGAAGVQVAAIAPVPEQDWVRLTQAQFEPVAITSSFWIVPSWHEPPAAAEVTIRLDPGLAFGTGTHPTTRMCLRWIAAQAGAGRVPPARSMLDYGCGSGILAIAAAKFGVPEVLAVDIDAAAVRATADNAANNGVRLATGLPAEASGRFGWVLANILARPLQLLAPLLAGHVAPDGWLVLAGLLERQAEDMRATYAPHLAIDVLDQEDGWVLMGGRRTSGRRVS